METSKRTKTTDVVSDYNSNRCLIILTSSSCGYQLFKYTGKASIALSTTSKLLRKNYDEYVNITYGKVFDKYKKRWESWDLKQRFELDVNYIEMGQKDNFMRYEVTEKKMDRTNFTYWIMKKWPEQMPVRLFDRLRNSLAIKGTFVQSFLNDKSYIVKSIPSQSFYPLRVCFVETGELNPLPLTSKSGPYFLVRLLQCCSSYNRFTHFAGIIMEYYADTLPPLLLMMLGSIPLESSVTWDSVFSLLMDILVSFTLQLKCVGSREGMLRDHTDPVHSCIVHYWFRGLDPTRHLEFTGTKCSGCVRLLGESGEDRMITKILIDIDKANDLLSTYDSPTAKVGESLDYIKQNLLDGKVFACVNALYTIDILYDDKQDKAMIVASISNMDVLSEKNGEEYHSTSGCLDLLSTAIDGMVDKDFMMSEYYVLQGKSKGILKDLCARKKLSPKLGYVIHLVVLERLNK